MKIKTKFTLEVILLVSLIGMVSIIAVLNTKQVQTSFLDLSSQTLPTWDALKDMRLANSLILSSTLEIMILQDRINSNIDQMNIVDYEEQIENKIYEIETAKSLFAESFTRYSILMEENFPESNIYEKDIAKNWNDLVIISNKIIRLNSNAENSKQVLELKNDLEDSTQLLNQNIFAANNFIEPQVKNKQDVVESLVDETTMQILIVLNIFIVTTLAFKFFITRSISRPLSKLRKITSKIADGDFVKTEMKGDDEISDLGKDIDAMSNNLQKLNKELVTSERLSSIGSLSSRLAHDLRNPLSVIKNSMEILKFRLNDNMDEKINHQIAMVGRAVSRMSHQIEDVLDFVNIASLKLENSSLVTIIESAILSTDLPKSVTISMPKNSATIKCDPYRLEVVFSNMLKNAAQAMDGNGEISVRILDQKDDVLIEIEDQGPGIPQENLDKIFEPLFTTKQSGTGLGLASCISIVEKHGGTISARNNPTVFTIKLPKVSKIEKIDEKRIEKHIPNE
ncbi:MAG TPA: ATP-binding protein [Nitrosopumilaceae archaeon]|nr:ATP-binding protein [Nitrosopumilaceae archaeon]